MPVIPVEALVVAFLEVVEEELLAVQFTNGHSRFVKGVVVV